MEALKKAELAKQASQNAPAGDENPRLEPVDSSAAAGAAEAPGVPGRNLPELPPQLEILDAEFMAHAESSRPTAAEKPAPRPTTPAHEATPPPRARSAAVAEAERMAAQQLFAAKKAERSRLGFRVAMGALVVVGSAAIGGYVWWQLQPKSGLATPGLASNMPRPMLAAPVAALPAPQAAAVAATQDTAPAAAVAMPSAPMKAVRDDDDAPPRLRAAAPRPAETESPIRITKSHLRVNPAAARGFEALSAGELETAKAEYLLLLDAEPRNGDALRGLAAVAMRQGDAAAAGDWYLKALEADPKDALAQAGLIGLRGHGGEPGDPLALESRLKTLIAARPDVGALHFALGNVHARQNRWSEAQQAFFKAFSAEPEHPDYAFNLAVSLDHLRQARLAAQYYTQALGLAAQRPAGFDKAQVAARLREIQP